MSQAMRITLVVEGLLLGLAWAGLRAFGIDLRPMTIYGLPELLWTAAGLAASVAIIAWTILGRSDALVQLRDLVRRRFGEMFAGTTALEFAAISVLAGVVEELLFRGLLQTLLVGTLGAWSGLLLTSALFGLAHPFSRAYCLLAALLGLIWGGLFLLTGSILVPVVGHALHDAIAFVAIVRYLPPGDLRLPS